MQVSSSAGALVQSMTSSATKAESRVEGNRPDGDSDRDDGSRVAASQSVSTTPAATGSVGSIIDITA